jgi:hypothetical protein
MSRLIRNKKLIGSTSNDSSHIIYDPSDTSRSETTVKSELDRINAGIPAVDVGNATTSWTNTETATSANQGASNYETLNAMSPSSTIKSLLTYIKSLLFGLSTQVTAKQSKSLSAAIAGQNTVESCLYTLFDRMDNNHVTAITQNSHGIGVQVVYHTHQSGCLYFMGTTDKQLNAGQAYPMSAVSVTQLLLSTAGYPNWVGGIEFNTYTVMRIWVADDGILYISPRENIPINTPFRMTVSWSY